jgi:hypothetical protein
MDGNLQWMDGNLQWMDGNLQWTDGKLQWTDGLRMQMEEKPGFACLKSRRLSSAFSLTPLRLEIRREHQLQAKLSGEGTGERRQILVPGARQQRARPRPVERSGHSAGEVIQYSRRNTAHSLLDGKEGQKYSRPMKSVIGDNVSPA